MESWLARDFYERASRQPEKKKLVGLAVAMIPFLGPVLTQSIGAPTVPQNSAAVSIKREVRSEFIIIVPPGCELDKSRHHKLRKRGNQSHDPTVNVLSNHWIGRDDNTSHAARLSEHPVPSSFGLPFSTIIYNKMIYVACMFRMADFVNHLCKATGLAEGPDTPLITNPPLNSSGICMYRLDLRINGVDVVIACWPNSINILRCHHEAEVARVAEMLLASLLPYMAIVTPDPMIKIVPLVVSFRVPGKYPEERAREIARLAGYDQITIAAFCPFIVALDIGKVSGGRPVVFFRSDGIVFYQDISLEDAVRAANLFSLGEFASRHSTLHKKTSTPPGDWRASETWLQFSGHVFPSEPIFRQRYEGWHLVLCDGNVVWTSHAELFFTQTWAASDQSAAHITEIVDGLRGATSPGDIDRFGPSEFHSCAWRPGPFTAPPELKPEEPAPPPPRFTRDATEWAAKFLP